MSSKPTIRQTRQTWSQQDIANFFRISLWTIWAMRQRGELPPAIRVGNQLRWRDEVIQAWLSEKESQDDGADPVLSRRGQRGVDARLGRKKTPRGRPKIKDKIEGGGNE